MKIAFDENVPIALVRVFQTFANERQLQRLSGKFEIKSAADYAPRPGDLDYVPKNDAPWLRRFAADGGKAIISGDTAMRYVAHERLALVELGLVVVFFENQWSDWKFFRKCALLLHWWPVIAAKIKVVGKRSKPGAFWHVPCNWKENGRLRKVSNDDPRRLKLEKSKGLRARKKRPPPPPQPSDGPLFEFADSKGRDDA